MVDNNTELVDVKPIPHPMTIEMTTTATTRSSAQGHLSLPLPPEATKAHIVPAFKRTLISIPQVVDSGYAVYFDELAVYIINTQTNKIEWEVKRNHITKLWDLLLQNTQTSNKLPYTFQTKLQAANNTSIALTLSDHIMFLHQACGNPVKSIWIRAINNNHYKLWPNLTAKNVNKYLPKSLHTLIGLMCQTRKNKSKLKKTITPKEL